MEETAEKIWEHLDPKPNYKIVVRYDNAGPMVLYREYSSLLDDTVEMLLESRSNDLRIQSTTHISIWA